MNLTVQTISSSDPFKMDDRNKFKLVGHQNNSYDGLIVAEQQNPTVILLDYEIEKINTPLFIKTLLAESTNSKIILLGHRLADEIILSCLSQGLYGFLESKDMDKFLIKSIQSVAQGEAWISRRLVGLLIETIRD